MTALDKIFSMAAEKVRKALADSRRMDGKSRALVSAAAIASLYFFFDVTIVEALLSNLVFLGKPTKDTTNKGEDHHNGDKKQ